MPSTRPNKSTRQPILRKRRRTPLVHLLLLLLCLINTHAQQETSRQVQKYDLPAFSLLLKVRVDEVITDDDDEVYLDLEIFKETLERVTQLHLTDVFQQALPQVKNEQFLRIQLSSKVRQDIRMEPEREKNRVHVPLHAAFAGVVSYSFPQGVLPPQDKVDGLIYELLESSLVAENYMLLFRRYLSSGALADIEDVQDVRIGTELLDIAEAPQEVIPSPIKKKSSSKKELNAVTIVAIVIFLTLSCLLMLFGATVVLLMKDRKNQEQAYNGQTMDSIGMGTTDNNKNPDDSDEDEDEGEQAPTITPAWKRAVLPVLRKAIMVRRYWRKHIRKQRKNGNKSTTPVPQPADNPNEAASANNIRMEDDDGLKDEDVYYDDDLTDEEAANQWLDAWSQSITSIPVRDIASNTRANNSASPNKNRKKKKPNKSPLAPRPAKRQSKKAFLCCIAEEDSVIDTTNSKDDSDIELALSTPTTTRSASKSNNTTKICLELDRIQELASVIMSEEDYPSPKSDTTSPVRATSLATSASFPGAYGSAKRLDFPDDEDEDEGRIHDVDLS